MSCTPMEVQEPLKVRLSYFNVPGVEPIEKESVVCVERSSAVLKNRRADEKMLDQHLRVKVGNVLSGAVKAIEERSVGDQKNTCRPSCQCRNS